jgi:ATP-dependent 26S proteasome regulatory subunit
MRPGRLDRILYVGPPDQEGREEILRIRMNKMAVDPSVDVEEIARMVSIFTLKLSVAIVPTTLDRGLFWRRDQRFMSRSCITSDAKGY